MSRNWYLLAAVAGALGTMVCAARHELGWTTLGAICVWCNIDNYMNGKENKDEFRD